MARGGRGGGRGGGGRKGPDLSWDDEEITIPTSNRPEPTFPHINLPTPKPLSKHEQAQVQSYLSFRERIRNGPVYSVLDPSGYTDEGTGKVNKRKGFDPFNDQVRYSSKYLKRRRTMPDLAAWKGQWSLEWYPRELWGILDPKHSHPLWETVPPNDPAFGRGRKRKRVVTAMQTDATEAVEGEEDPAASDHDSETSSVVNSGRRRATKARTRRDDPTTKAVAQKKGLDAEDDYGDVEQNAEGEEEGEEGEEEPQDSEFEESDDGQGDDYNAEQYFETGEGEDDDTGGGGGDDEGGYYQ